MGLELMACAVCGEDCPPYPVAPGHPLIAVDGRTMYGCPTYFKTDVLRKTAAQGGMVLEDDEIAEVYCGSTCATVGHERPSAD